MNEPQLFVICNNCGSEVSPYVTECPYCGKRLRKRAPDLAGGKRTFKRERRWRRRRTSLQAVESAGSEAKPGRSAKRGRRAKRPAPTRREAKSRLSFETERPRAMIGLIGLAAVVVVATRISDFPFGDVIVNGPLGLGSEPWVFVTAPLVHEGFGYAFIALVAAAIFGSSLEFRHGWWWVLGLWLIAGAAGVGAELAVNTDPLALGANATSAALLFCWSIETAQRGEEFDRYALLAIGGAVLALPLITAEASVWATVAGALIGSGAGLIAARRPRS